MGMQRFRNCPSGTRRLALAAAALQMPLAAGMAQPTAEPLTVEVQSEDARRFAALFEASGGRPSAEQLQSGYLDGAGYGIEVFTPNRIRNAEHLAAQIAADPQKYRRAIDVCLPLAEAASADLRSIYLGLSALFPDRELPAVYVVFGAGNSGGTAGPGAQVLGLEVICDIARTPDEIRRLFRFFFAHETTHALQPQYSEAEFMTDPLLNGALREGVADFVSILVTGTVPDPARDSFALANEDELWSAFEADRLAIRDATGRDTAFADMSEDAGRLFRRWLQNYGSAPDGWPHELGYWIGRRIAESYFDNAEDKRSAFNALIHFDDAATILAGSDYAMWVGAQ